MHILGIDLSHRKGISWALMPPSETIYQLGTYAGPLEDCLRDIPIATADAVIWEKIFIGKNAAVALRLQGVSSTLRTLIAARRRDMEFIEVLGAHWQRRLRFRTRRMGEKQEIYKLARDIYFRTLAGERLAAGVGFDSRHWRDECHAVLIAWDGMRRLKEKEMKGVWT